MGGGQYSLQMQFTDNNLLGHEAGWGKAESESGGTSKRLGTPVLHALTRRDGPRARSPHKGAQAQLRSGARCPKRGTANGKTLRKDQLGHIRGRGRSPQREQGTRIIG